MGCGFSIRLLKDLKGPHKGERIKSPTKEAHNRARIKGTSREHNDDALRLGHDPNELSETF